MSCKKIFLLFFFITFDSLFPSTFGADVLYEIRPFIRVYQNGTVERLIGTDFAPPSLDPKSRVFSKDIIIEKKSNLSARLFRPNSAAAIAKLPLLIYFHGGAFVAGSPFSPTYHNYMTSVVALANAVAVSVNYSLAPEQPLPIGYHDSWLALNWVFSHSKEGGGEEPWLRDYVDFGRVYLGGDSAGGNIAHNILIRAGSEKTGIAVRGMFMSYPHFWGEIRIGNESDYPPGVVETMDSIWIHAYPNSTGLDDPEVNPTLDPNISKLGCEEVLVYVAEKDILKDRGLEYVEALEESGWEGVVKGVEVKGAVHGFNFVDPNTTESKDMMRHLALFLNEREFSERNMQLQYVQSQ